MGVCGKQEVDDEVKDMAAAMLFRCGLFMNVRIGRKNVGKTRLLDQG